MLVRYFDQHVLDSIRNSVAADQVNQLWLSHPSLGNVGDPLGYSGREEQQLCLGSALAKYKLDIIFESITQQSIQLIVLVAQIRREQTTYAEREREREREREIPSIKHLISLVKDQSSKIRKNQVSTLDVVHHTTRSSNHNVRLCAKRSLYK
jgi:hypothetical protein